MRKKSSYSEENILSASNAKVSEYFRQNPRFPKKMKPVKTKHPLPHVRTVGQLSCGGKNAFSTTLGFQNISGGEPVRKTSDLGEAWSKIHRTFSNNQSPRNAGDYAPNESPRFCGLLEHELEHEGRTGQSVQTSESGVQVNIFHCHECRRHIEFGKTYKSQNTCSDSEPENQELVTNCTHCERKQDMVAGIGVDDEENSNRTETLSHGRVSLNGDDLTPHDRSPSRERNLSSKSDTFSKNEGAEIQEVIDEVPQIMKISKGWKQFWASNIKVMTAAIVIIPLIFHLAQIQTLSTLSSAFYFYFKNIIVQEETEKFSYASWIFDLFFGVQGVTKLRPFYLYLF